MVDTGTAAVVVHHRSPDTLAVTVASLRREDIDGDRIVVVDNSEDPEQDLAACLPGRPVVLEIPNRGYGAAANRGIEFLLGLTPPPSRILISTHEVRPEPGAVAVLEAALERAPDVAAVGPTVNSSKPDGAVHRICGGRFTALLNEPRHILELAGKAKALPESPLERDWLDGAFVLYRSWVLEQERFREDFFLYYEESELHARLGKRGWPVAWVPEAEVHELAAGVPPFLRGRNLQRFQQLHGSRLSAVLTVPLALAKASVKAVAGRAGWGQVRQLATGWLAALRSPARPR